jgi:hypothetical protein
VRVREREREREKEKEREAFARFKISQIYSGNSNLSHVAGNGKAIK